MEKKTNTVVLLAEVHTWVNNVMFKSLFSLEAIKYLDQEYKGDPDKREPLGQLQTIDCDAIGFVEEYIEDVNIGFIYLNTSSFNIVEQTHATDPYTAFSKLQKLFPDKDKFCIHETSKIKI